MPRPTVLQSPDRIQSPDIYFVRPFSVDSTPEDTAAEMTHTFLTVTSLAREITRITTYEPGSVDASLGILDQHFSLESMDHAASTNNIRLAPMGVNTRGILLGCIPTVQLGLTGSHDPLNLFGGDPPQEYHGFAYAAIDTSTAMGNGFGNMAMKGNLTVFERRPDDKDLAEVIDVLASSTSSTVVLPQFVRLDTTKDQAKAAQNSRHHRERQAVKA